MAEIGSIATLRHGYTMSDLTRLAKQAVSGARYRGGDYDDRFEAAWFGVVEALYEADDAPTEAALRLAGMEAITRLWNEVRKAHGVDDEHGWQARRAFDRFWASTSSPTVSHEERCVERLALPAVLGELTAVQYEALAAAAVHPTLRAAAEALGISYNTFQYRLYSAKEIVRRLWFSPDTPPSQVVTETKCKSGHAKADHWKVDPSGHGYCGRCQTLALRRRRARGGAA